LAYASAMDWAEGYSITDSLTVRVSIIIGLPPLERQWGVELTGKCHGSGNHCAQCTDRESMVSA
jgi:hypothetical protein